MSHPVLVYMSDKLAGSDILQVMFCCLGLQFSSEETVLAAASGGKAVDVRVSPLRAEGSYYITL